MQVKRQPSPAPNHHPGDDITVVGLISVGDESAYRDKVEQLTVWCGDNNFLLNTSKTKELIVENGHSAFTHQQGLCGEGLRLLLPGGPHHGGPDLGSKHSRVGEESSAETLLSEGSQEEQHPSKSAGVLLWLLYREHLTYCLCVWFSSCTVAQRKALQGVRKVTQKIVGCPLPSLEELHSSRCLKKAQNILQDSSHPGHNLFGLLPPGRWYRTIKTRTNRLKNSFYPTAIHVLHAAKA